MIFDNLEVFQSWFGFKNIGKQTQVEDIVDDEQQSRIVSKLHEILRPFLLRRMKRDVLSFIPLKKEVSFIVNLVYCIQQINSNTSPWMCHSDCCVLWYELVAKVLL